MLWRVVLCFRSFDRWCVVVVFVLGLSSVCGFLRLCWVSFFASSPFRAFAVRGLEGELVVAFVRLVDDLVQVFSGESLLSGGCCVCSCVSEVVCGPVCCVYHVGLFV